MRTIRFVLLTAAAAASLPAGARAADPGFCDRYAHQAVEQFERNTHIPGCFHGENGRWHPDFRRHYDWCLGAPYEAARNEAGIRHERLEECRAHAHGY